MASQSTVLPEPRRGAAPALDFSQVREEVLRAYQPATAEESLLATQIARAWFRLQKYYDLEAGLMEKQSLPEMFEEDLARFKALNSAIASAERMWRNALKEFQAARRRGAASLGPAVAVEHRRPEAVAGPNPANSRRTPGPEPACVVPISNPAAAPGDIGPKAMAQPLAVHSLTAAPHKLP